MAAPWHFITPEYPPKIGGVGDYTRLLARELAASGVEVHVWCPIMKAGLSPVDLTVAVHPTLGDLRSQAIAATNRELDRFPKPRRLIVQWSAFGYGWHSMNLPFVSWLCQRARRDLLEVMFHESFQDFAGRLRHYVMAGVQRVMAAALLASADRVWCSTPTWIDRMKPYTPRRVRPRWLPIPSNVPSRDPDLRATRPFVLGHFGTYGPQTVPLLEPVLAASPVRTLLVGANSEAFRSDFVSRHPDAADRVMATGPLPLEEVREHLHRCEIMVQPVAGGVTVRNATALACLANGRPVVTNAGRFTESCWAENNAALLLSDFRPDIAVGAIDRLQRDPAEKERLSLGARSWYDRVFDVRHGVAALRAG